ncbi:hypothetical protein ACXKU5_004398 [Yersinia enterocolitica]|uniref:hypothetical protein n=1 Tax=Morganella morganii TaxID=582 RepID=UPI000FB3B235|nr:hypothetical protein [Yersinia enterocolitica]
MASVHKLASVLIALSLYLFLLDVILLGSGAWSINIVGFSLRKIEYAVMLTMVMVTISSFRGYIYICMALLFCLVSGIIVPLANNVKLEYATTELLSLLGILLCPLIVQNSFISSHWLRIRKFIFILTILSALCHIAVWVVGLSGSSYIDSIRSLLIRTLTISNDDLIDNILIADTPDGLFRVLLPSSSLLVIGFYISLQKLVRDRHFFDYFIVGIMIIALFSTWTRALYLSPALLLLGLCIYKLFPLTLKLGGIGTYLLFTSLIVLFILISGGLVHPEVLSLLGISSETSDDVRFEQVAWILNTFLEHPIFGTGLGGSAEDIRSLVAPWTYEMSLLALIMKLGVVGCLFFVVISASQIPHLLSGFFNGEKLSAQKVIWLMFSFSILIMFSTNPFMLSFPGVTLTFFILGELNYFMKE